MLFRRNATDRRAGNAGFVLLEVLVAVGVAAVLMAVLIRSFSTTWSGISFVREEAEGTMLARGLLADAVQRGRLTPGSQEGVIGRYAWKLTTVLQPVAGAQPQQKDEEGSNASALYHVVLVLVGPSGRSNRLDAFEIGPAAAR